MEPFSSPESTFDTTVLRKAGLTESQAKGYLALVQHGELTPTELATYTDESRTNAYMIADKLVSLGLASKKEDVKRATYTPLHPSSIEALAERRRKATIRNEQQVKEGISPLIDLFYKYREEPGTRTLQGLEGIKEVFADVIRTREDVYFIRTTTDIQTLPDDFFRKHQEERAALGITTHALTPPSPQAEVSIRSGRDDKLHFHRTFYPGDAYSAPVEIQVYGDKLALIAYGDTQMATIITSPPVAEAVRQVFTLLASTLHDYSEEVRSSIIVDD
ncbi:MAG: helix-turn-helix domain-containing protein [Candidatus Saccharimonas sp.]